MLEVVVSVGPVSAFIRLFWCQFYSALSESMMPHRIWLGGPVVYFCTSQYFLLIRRVGRSKQCFGYFFVYLRLVCILAPLA